MSKRAGSDTSQTPQSQASAGEGVLTPASTPSHTPVPSLSFRDTQNKDKMDEKPPPAATEERQETEKPASTTDQKPAEEAQKPKTAASKKKKCEKHKHKSSSRKADKKHVTKRAAKDDPSDESSDTESDSDGSESESSSEDEKAKKKRRAKKSKAALKKAKEKKHKKSKKQESSSESEDADSESETSDESSEEETPKRKKKSAKKSKKAVVSSDSDESSEDERPKRKKKASKKKTKKVAKPESESEDSEPDDGSNDINDQVAALKLQLKQAQASAISQPKLGRDRRSSTGAATAKGKKKSSKAKKADASSFQRVDQLWDSKIHDYKLKESAGAIDTEFAEYAFLVRRRFDWENKYLFTVVDIKSKHLRSALAEVMKDCKSVSLEAEEPTIDPNTLFLYLEELRKYYKKTLPKQIKKAKKKDERKKLEQQRKMCKLLVKYIDEDFADTKKTLYPLLEAGNITFDLLWALFKPNEIAITSCYGSWEEPRCFKVDYANKFSTLARGEYYCIEGSYMEYDGKNFGMGDFEVEIDGFKGPRKINSLATYPLKYHKDEAGVKKQILERGKRFVETEGQNYRFHKGMAFMKKKKQILKININGRIMVDPAIFRRINPNYPINLIKPKEAEELFSDCDCSDSEQSDDEDNQGGGDERLKHKDSDNDSPKIKYKYVETDDGCCARVPVEVDDDGNPLRSYKVDALKKTVDKQSFTEEELLLTSPVVFGFAFNEKLWLEFTLSGVREIEYNENAFDSLVLPPNQKSIVRALVESHKFHGAKAIDDVVQGKGKGLVAVLHGPPGTGKTLTAEGISELLKCPLYMVSAGELGTDPAKLEYELQKILDIAHSWGAVLLLDEADVFLEKREVHDIHRNALVSIFLRLLEYFQGILFLTTNRVETFDDAFQSRIHIALRYGELTAKAKKSVWKMFLDRCREKEGTEVADFSDYDLDILSRKELNGRQIKNAVRTAQALALNEKKMLTLQHIKQVLEVSESFDRDLKGGSGYLDAMRSYT